MTVPIQTIIEDPSPWGALAVAPEVRPGAPALPFRVLPGKVDPGQRIARARRVHEDNLRNTDLIGGDMLLHTGTGLIGRVVQRIDPWDFFFEAWTLPDDERGLAQLRMHGLEGEWICWGHAVMPGERIPSWFPFEPIPIMQSHLADGRPNPEYGEAFLDLHPGVRQGRDPRVEHDPHRVGFKKPGDFTAKERAIMAHQREGMRRFIEGEGLEALREKLKKLDEPMEDGESREVFIGAEEPKPGRSISYKDQDKRA